MDQYTRDELKAQISALFWAGCIISFVAGAVVYRMALPLIESFK